MRTIVLLVVVGLSACASRAPKSTLALTGRYACGDLQIERAGERLTAMTVTAEGPLEPTTLSWRDEHGDHFVRFPTAVTDVEAIEYVLPHDPRADAVEKLYDTSKGRSASDWRLTRRRVCRADGGYTDAFARWSNGSSLDDITSQLSLADRAAARALVHRALVDYNRRYYSDGSR
jgi:hypothetical protein